MYKHWYGHEASLQLRKGHKQPRGFGGKKGKFYCNLEENEGMMVSDEVQRQQVK